MSARIKMPRSCEKCPARESCLRAFDKRYVVVRGSQACKNRLRNVRVLNGK
jgi:hypothetical protein